MDRLVNERPYADPNHPGNRLRAHIQCIGCRKLGCVTYWGRWCFKCNVERIDRISGSFAEEVTYRGLKT